MVQFVNTIQCFLQIVYRISTNRKRHNNYCNSGSKFQGLDQAVVILQKISKFSFECFLKNRRIVKG